ncbi:MAG: phytanoyl-CoA dioxygenase family protein [Pirellulales bacterium]|nr:phytanoyl-CoA dioxygenase family protein [Pirellulales bacterium]
MDIEPLVNEYRRDGVVRIRELFRREEVEEIRRQLDRYIREVMPTVPETDRVLEADGRAVRNLWRLAEHDPWFAEIGRRPEILELVARLVNGEPVLKGVETFNKPARVGSAVPYHQDNAYFCQTPPDMLTVWIAIDPATEENGAVYYRKGSHHVLLPHKPSGVKGNSMALADPPQPDPAAEFLGALEPGDALVHHSQTIHRSEPNRSGRSRLALLLVYHGSHTQTDPHLKEMYDRALAQVPK